MDLGVVMSPDVFEEKLGYAHDGKGSEGTWNTRRLPKNLEAGWNNRFFVACAGVWRGWFPLSGEVLWCPEDETAPYTLIFDACRWARMVPIAASRFRGWRYVDGAALLAAAAAPGRTSSSSS
jgi:hypothetical protein